MEFENQRLKIPRLSFFFGVAVLLGLVIFVAIHFGEAKEFVELIWQAEPQWLLLAVILQSGTYVCAGSIWHAVIKSAGQWFPLSTLTRLSVLKMSVNQLFPAAGISGNFFAFSMMKRLGLPRALAMESVLVDIFTFYIAYAAAAAAAVGALWLRQDIVAAVKYLLIIFSVSVIVVPMIFLWLMSHRDKKLPAWLLRFKLIALISESVRDISMERVLSFKLLAYSGLLAFSVFVLDALTLWTALKMVGVDLSMLGAFGAFVIASITGTLSLMPAGLGGFEAGLLFVLTSFGVSIEAALAATLILRGFTLWIPLIPGVILARRELVAQPLQLNRSD